MELLNTASQQHKERDLATIKVIQKEIDNINNPSKSNKEKEGIEREAQAKREKERAEREAQAKREKERAEREAQAKREKERAEREAQARRTAESQQDVPNSTTSHPQSENFLEKIKKMKESGKSDHEILGVSPDSSDQEFKKAYKKLVLKAHPDKNPSNIALATEVTKILTGIKTSRGL